MFFDLLKIVALGLNTIILILVAVAYYTLAERKVMAAIQRRLGPNVVGI
jgi:NADH:ubiquinone oxidoreductase subunit H